MSNTTTAAPPQTSTTTWNIDPAHSVAEFKVKHMMIANVKGQFSKVSGALVLDESDVANSRVEASIAAASILAKVERDRMVREWDPVFPVYGLASNKGYSTPHHLAALRQHGPSPLHRQSFAPVWNNPVPQEVLAFMLEDAKEEASSCEEAV